MNSFSDIIKRSISIASSKWETRLLIDALYFHAARKACEQAKRSTRETEKALRYFESLCQKERDILESHNDDHWKAGDEWEQICIAMESADYDIGEAYGPHLQSIAIVHILCSAALEYHINFLAKDSLKRRFWNHFDGLSLEGKWLYLPKMLNLNGFDPGKQPFQSFSRLLKYRNELVHYKGQKEEWIGWNPPLFLEKIGLTLDASKKSISCVQKMIIEISKQMNKEPPFWLRDDLTSINYFGLTISDPKG